MVTNTGELMPSDANIYSMLQQPKTQGPMELAGQAMQIRGMMDQGQLNSLQRQQLERGMAEEDAVRQAFSGMQPGQTIGDILPNVMKVAPKAGVALQKTVTDQQKAQADLEKTRLESHGLEMKQLRDDLASVSNDSQLQRYVQRMHSLSGGKGQYDGPTSVSDPNFQTWRQQSLMTADKMIVGAEAQMADTRTREEGALNRGVTTRGQDMTDARARDAAASAASKDKLQIVTDTEGNITVVDKNTGVGRPATDADGNVLKGRQNMTESQGKAAGMALRAREANGILGKLEGEGVSNRGIIKQGLSTLPVIGGALEMGANMLPGVMGGPSGPQQQVEQARRNFVNAVLRVESGASISESEFRNAEKQYFPMPGDTEAVRKQKADNRESAISALELQSGPQKSKNPMGPGGKSVMAGGGKIKFLGME